MANKPMTFDGVTKFDWIEDFDDEDNGKYQHTCGDCDVTFLGHKRRFSQCKRCWIKFAEGLVVERYVEIIKQARSQTNER